VVGNARYAGHEIVEVGDRAAAGAAPRDGHVRADRRKADGRGHQIVAAPAVGIGSAAGLAQRTAQLLVGLGDGSKGWRVRTRPGGFALGNSSEALLLGAQLRLDETGCLLADRRLTFAEFRCDSGVRIEAFVVQRDSLVRSA
jgi:hypothetical protein